MNDLGNKSLVLHELRAAHLDYVMLDDGSIWSTEQLWQRLEQSLLDALAAKQVVRRKGRPARGPGSYMLDGDEGAVAAQVYEAYEDISRPGQPAAYAAVARKLKISTTTLWRWRQKHEWPPRRPGA